MSGMQANDQPVCIFCKLSTGPFASIEHIFPESLGNKEKILSKGVVCDTCNSGVLSTLDQALVEFDPILFLRTFHGVQSKRGKVPSAPFGSVRLENPTGQHVRVELDSDKHLTEKPGGFDLKFTGKKRMDAKNLKLVARALYKIGLELIYLDHGKEFVLSSRFDEARQIILGKQDFHGYLLVGGGSKQHTGVSYRFLKAEDGTEFACFEFSYMLVKIIYDMERRIAIPDNGTKLMGFNVLKF
jgi:hypothetical protein